MKIRLHNVYAVAVALALLAGCREDPEQAANKLFVEAAPLWTQYQSLPLADPSQFDVRLQLLLKIQSSITSIVREYPGSSLAVEMLSSGKIKQLDANKIDNEILRLQKTIYCENSKAECVISLPLAEVKAIKNNNLRTRALAAVAKGQATGGDVAGAKSTLELAMKSLVISDNSNFAWNFAATQVAMAQASVGDSIAALKTVEIISDEFVAISALASVAEVQASAGDIGAALKTLEGIDNSSSDLLLQIQLSTAIANVAKAQASYGDVTGANSTIILARSLLKKLNNLKAIYKPLAAIARAEAAAGDFSKAQSTISVAMKAVEGFRDVDSGAYVYALAVIAEAQTSMGDVNGAKSNFNFAINALNSSKSNADGVLIPAVIVLAEVQAYSGDVAGAIETIDHIEDDLRRPLGLAAVAKGQASAGDITGAQSTISLAMKALESIKVDNARDWMLADVACKLAEVAGVF